MCFDYDYDWYAEICDKTESHNLKYGTRCDECSEIVPLGARLFSVYQQEHEDCQCAHCEQVDNEKTEFDQDECDKDYGETYECDTCERCQCLKHAVEKAEIEAGCPAGSRLPPLGMLIEALMDDVDPDDLKKYTDKFREMYPQFELPRRLRA